MLRYIVKRLILAVVVFGGITVLVFVLSSMAPGNPVLFLLASPEATVEEIEIITREMGLDRPLYIQYFNWAGEFLKGNLGTSYRTFRPVSSMVMERIGATLILTITATLISLLFAIPLGTLAAYRPDSPAEYLSSAIAFIGASTPVFFAALVFIYFFCARLQILPLGGMYSSSRDRNIVSLLIHLILPATTLAINHMGSYIRQTRSAVLEVLGEDYVRTARSKGLSEQIVVFRHAMRNALIPIVTQIGMSIPFLIGGAVVTEQIFGWPGLGSLMVASVTARDYPAIMGIASIIAMVVLLANIVVDLLYGFLDPRIRYN
jgi:peptide/nickel transport system permease protein